jgi:signal transduction histidine kinase
MSGLRGRLFAYLAAAAALSVVITVAVALVLGQGAARHDVRQALDRQADAAATAFAAGHPRRSGQPRVFLLRRGLLIGPVPGVRARTLSAAAADHAEGSVNLTGQELIYARRETSAGPIVVVRPAGPQTGDVRAPGWIVLVAGAGGLVLAALLAAVLARRLVRPVRDLTEATRPLARGERDVRVPVTGADELSELGRAFNRMADELDRARDAQQRFLSAVSHDLRTPLTSVRGYAEALEDGALPPTEAGAAIAAEAARLERLVGDLLELAATGRTDFSVRGEPVDLAAIAQTARERHAAAATEAGVELSATGRGWARADAGRVLQALSNLVDNAVRVTPPGGTVVIEVGPGRLAVLDEGPGLDAADLERVFEPFALHHRHGAGRAGAAGLGLAIVHGLIAAMGGRVRAERRPTGGAALVVELPSAQPEDGGFFAPPALARPRPAGSG